MVVWEQGGLNEPKQASPVFAIAMIAFGVFLAFVVLSALFSPGWSSFARYKPCMQTDTSQ